MDTNQMTFSTGYVGSMGVSWKTPTQEDLEKAISGAMEIEGKTRDEIITTLEAGGAVRWCKSPNYYYDHSFGKIGTKRTPKPVELILCSCGHEVEAGQVMSASMGSSCYKCYDRMSD